jgi:nucleoside diphosphate kinase
MEDTSEFIASIVAEFIHRSEFIRAGTHELALPTLRPFLTRDRFRTLRSIQFLLIKPDAIASGKAKALIARIASSGFSIVYSKLVQRVIDEQLENLYKYNLNIENPKSMIGNWWISRQAYPLAPALAIVIFSPSGASPYSFFEECKGPSNPYLGKPGELRFDLSATSRPLNLIHSSDDPISTLREWLIFSDRTLIELILQEVLTGSVEAIATRAALELKRAHESLELLDLPATDGSFPMSLVRVLRRAQLIASPELALPKNLCVTAKNPREAVLALQEYLLGWRRNFNPTEYSCELSFGMVRMLDLLSLDNTKWREFSGFGEVRGLYISPWERLIIESNINYREDYACALQMPN